MSELMVRLAGDLQPDSIVDGEGIRTVIWFQGCAHHCPGCQNPESHDFHGGFLKSVEEIVAEIRLLELQDGVTFSGGDPLFQPEALLALLQAVHGLGMTNWVYTGFTFEQLIRMGEEKRIYMDILREIDVLVDGKFEMDKRSFDVMFRGSGNQRIIDMKKSLEDGIVFEIAKYK